MKIDSFKKDVYPVGRVHITPSQDLSLVIEHPLATAEHQDGSRGPTRSKRFLAT